MNQLARYIIALAVVAVVCFLAWYFSDILTYILIAAILSIMGKPLVGLLDSLHYKTWRIPHNISALIALIVVIGVFSTLFIFLVPLFSQIIHRLSMIDMDQIVLNLSVPLQNINRFLHEYVPGIDSDVTVQNLFSQYIASFINDFDLTRSLNSLAAIISKFGIGLFSVCFITFFFIREKDMFNNIVLSLFPEKKEQNAIRALQSTNRLLSRYFIGICIETLAITILNTLGLTLICGFDFKLAIVLAFASGVLNVIPYIGPVVGGLIGVSFGVLGYYQTAESMGLFFVALPIALVYTITNLIDVFIFQPFIYSNSVRAHPLEIFMVILIAGSIGGVIGMLVAIPAYTVIRVFAREFFYNFKVVQKLTRRIGDE
ncbi:MAG: AI-2E family transporter [Bacteroidales bacterium]|nr:AI-2E family transporter [Bacteroidales bacterium]MCL2737893.1 AI-2E family transporter [Bacteroidales bacterium]